VPIDITGIWTPAAISTVGICTSDMAHWSSRGYNKRESMAGGKLDKGSLEPQSLPLSNCGSTFSESLAAVTIAGQFQVACHLCKVLAHKNRPMRK